MARRSLAAFLAAAITAMMIGFLNVTGLAPPPPLMVEEDVEWLSPETERDPGIDITLLEDAPEDTAEPGEPSLGATSARPGRVRSLLSRLRRRR